MQLIIVPFNPFQSIPPPRLLARLLIKVELIKIQLGLQPQRPPPLLYAVLSIKVQSDTVEYSLEGDKQIPPA